MKQLNTLAGQKLLSAWETKRNRGHCEHRHRHYLQEDGEDGLTDGRTGLRDGHSRKARRGLQERN
jgi:hypothetical protein